MSTDVKVSNCLKNSLFIELKNQLKLFEKIYKRLEFWIVFICTHPLLPAEGLHGALEFESKFVDKLFGLEPGLGRLCGLDW